MNIYIVNDNCSGSTGTAFSSPLEAQKFQKILEKEFPHLKYKMEEEQLHDNVSSACKEFGVKDTSIEHKIIEIDGKKYKLIEV